jgi:uncharacterized protein YbjT (DUF2867 family)
VASQVVRGLLNAGEDVRALSHDASRARAVLGPNIDLVTGEWNDPAVIDRALDGVDRVFLAVGITPSQDTLESPPSDVRIMHQMQ